MLRLKDVSKYLCIALVLLSLGACHPSHTSPKARESTGLPSGTITGIAQPCVGPASVPAGYVLEVRLQRLGRNVATQKVKAPFAFSFKMPPGDYRVVVQGDLPVALRLAVGEHKRVDVPSTCR